MPRANRFFVPNHVWHITHRCHNQDFLLKFARDRQCWVRWLYAARTRFRVSILNYTVTSNHVHLLVKDNTESSDIPSLMQLVAGRTAQEFNQRKQRKGSFWEDRYHATAIETGQHLWSCLIYIDLNMVRAGVVKHPRDWPFGGYHEILGRKVRNRILDLRGLSTMLEVDDLDALRRQYQDKVDEAVVPQELARDKRWTESLAVGSSGFIEEFQSHLKARGKGRQVMEDQGRFVLREGLTGYGDDF